MLRMEWKPYRLFGFVNHMGQISLFSRFYPPIFRLVIYGGMAHPFGHQRKLAKIKATWGGGKNPRRWGRVEPWQHPQSEVWNGSARQPALY